METVTSMVELCARLRALAPGTLVGLEGFCSSGKTPLANELGERMQMSVFHTDEFARKFDAPPSYPECVDIHYLRRAMEMGAPSRPSIIEGICLRDVLALVGISPTIFVYLKRIGRNGLWYDGLHLEDFEAGHTIPGLTEEPHLSDFKYHTRSRPHECADLIYEQIENE